MFYVTCGYAYRLASKHGWRRYRHPNGGVRYRMSDVRHALEPGADGRLARRKVKSGIVGSEV